MAGLEPDRDTPAELVEDERRLSSPASSDKKDLILVDDDDDDDNAHAGLEFPSDEELLTLRRVSDKLPWTAYSQCLLSFFCFFSLTLCAVIAIVELAERFSVSASV